MNGIILALKRAAVGICAVSLAWSAGAWQFDGTVICPLGKAYQGVVINVVGTNYSSVTLVGATFIGTGPTGAYTNSVTTDSDGNYLLPLPEVDGIYTATIDITTLPDGSTVTHPAISHVIGISRHQQILEGTVNWTVDGPGCESNPRPIPGCKPVYSNIRSFFYPAPIASGRWIWFNSTFKLSGLFSHPATILFDNSTVNFTANGVPVTLDMPPAIITFDRRATTATTSFDPASGAWITVVPETFTGSVFLTGAGYKVPFNFPGGLNPVSWNGEFSANTANLAAHWQWEAAVYSTFNANLAGVHVKPVDNSSLSQYPNNDHAGTPENFKSYLIKGARSLGGSNWTGSYGTTANVMLCTNIVIFNN